MAKYIEKGGVLVPHSANGSEKKGQRFRVSHGSRQTFAEGIQEKIREGGAEPEGQPPGAAPVETAAQPPAPPAAPVEGPVCQNPECAKPIEYTGKGRRKSYCDGVCKRRAKYLRDKAKGGSGDRKKRGGKRSRKRGAAARGRHNRKKQ